MPTTTRHRDEILDVLPQGASVAVMATDAPRHPVLAYKLLVNDKAKFTALLEVTERR